MPTQRLSIEGRPAWELEHFLPPLWLWFFDPAAITESRRLHATLFDGAARFQDQHRRATGSPFFADLLAPFAGIRPDKWHRDLGEKPDAILMLDLAELERTRPYRHETAAARMETFLAACESGDDRAALRTWEDAVLCPLPFTGGKQRDAIMLAARAEEFRLAREDRAEALVWHLMGRPVSRAARGLNHDWTALARGVACARYLPRRPLWRRLLP